jgi:hypothetical protein
MMGLQLKGKKWEMNQEWLRRTRKTYCGDFCMLAWALTADSLRWLLENLIRKWDPFYPAMLPKFKISVLIIQRSTKLTPFLRRSQIVPPSLLLFIQGEMRSMRREEERTCSEN